jgi:hypothetical protein
MPSNEVTDLAAAATISNLEQPKSNDLRWPDFPQEI